MMGLTQRELRSDEPDALDLPDGRARWFAVTVRHQHERRVGAALEMRQMNTLVPTYRVRNQWSDRVKEIELPLFSGYVFCRFTIDERARVLTTPGVRNIVGFGDKLAPVDDDEIAAIDTMIRSNAPIRPWPHLKPGDRVRVERGPLRGVTGTLIRERDVFRLVIGVELLQRSVAVEIAPEMVMPC
jgi:transcription antitermination factor NusG